MPQKKLFEAAFLQARKALVITDADLAVGCRLQSANIAFLSMTGYSLDELRGKSLSVLQGPATDPKVIDELRACLKDGRFFEGRTTNYRKDGSDYEVRWSISPLHDENGEITHFLSVQEDISELARIERTNRLLARALDSTSDLVMLTDGQRRVVFVNAAFEKTTGYSLAEIKGQTAALLKSGEHDEAFYAGMHRTLSTGHDFRATFINRRRDGSLFHVEQTISAIFDDDGNITHHIGVSKDVTKRVKREKALWHAATKDKLTGLYNRYYGEKTLRTAFLNAEANGESLSLIIVDIDHFKGINDHFGHPVGDLVLTAVADILRGAVRSEDTVIRWGGDEFVVVLTNCTIDHAAELAERVRSRIFAHHDGTFGSVTVSLGAAQLMAGETIDELMGRADVGLYDAKRAGRNRLSFSKSMPIGLLDDPDCDDS